jgi:hypothetical protein
VGWLLFEVLIALAIAGGIVWWTIPKTPRQDPPRDRADDAPRE